MTHIVRKKKSTAHVSGEGRGESEMRAAYAEMEKIFQIYLIVHAVVMCGFMYKQKYNFMWIMYIHLLFLSPLINFKQFLCTLLLSTLRWLTRRHDRRRRGSLLQGPCFPLVGRLKAAVSRKDRDFTDVGGSMCPHVSHQRDSRNPALRYGCGRKLFLLCLFLFSPK